MTRATGDARLRRTARGALGEAAAYVRVSSKAQTLAMQRDAIEREARARGDRVATWYCEKESARTLVRPVLQQLRADVCARRVRKLYVYRLDRLARSGIRDTFEVVEEFRRFECELVTVGDGFNLEGPAADVILAVMAWAAKMERHAINERIAAARKRLEAEGRPWGRPSRIDDLTRERIARLRREGRTVREIAIAVKVPRATVGRVLSQNTPLPRPSREVGTAAPRGRPRGQG